jgi:hypothetical protein
MSARLVDEGLALARKVGNRYWEWAFLGFAYPLFALGRWDEVAAREGGLPEEDWSSARIAFAALMPPAVAIRVNRGQLEDAKRNARFFAELESSADVQEQGQLHLTEATLLQAEGKGAAALVAAGAGLDLRDVVGMRSECLKEAFVIGLEAAFAVDDMERVEELLAIVETLPPGRSSRFLEAHAQRFRARLAARQAGAGDADGLFALAARGFREIGFRFYLAVTLLEHSEWLARDERGAEVEPLLAESREIFEQLDARPWLERAAQLAPEQPPAHLAPH